MKPLYETFLEYSTASLERYDKQIDGCLNRLSEEQIWERENPHANTVANLILHLIGNLGQFVVSAIGGAPDTRRRDEEFNALDGPSKAVLRKSLSLRLGEVQGVLSGLSEARLSETVTVQGKFWTVTELIYQVVQHFGLHTGQIMMRTKQLTGAELGFTTHKR